MKVREVIAALAQQPPDDELVMPSCDGSMRYVGIAAIEQNYHVLSNGELWFPDGDYDAATGTVRKFKKSQRPPVGSPRVVVLWEVPAQPTEAEPGEEIAAPLPARVRTARAAARRPARTSRLSRPRSFEMALRIGFLILLAYVAFQTGMYKYVMASTLVAAAAGGIVIFVVFAPMKGRR